MSQKGFRNHKRSQRLFQGIIILLPWCVIINIRLNLDSGFILAKSFNFVKTTVESNELKL